MKENCASFDNLQADLSFCRNLLIDMKEQVKQKWAI